MERPGLLGILDGIDPKPTNDKVKDKDSVATGSKFADATSSKSSDEKELATWRKIMQK